MTAKCPNDASHKRFKTTATVQETWVVDEHGNFIDVHSSDATVFEPNAGNVWVCARCGARAEVNGI